MKPIGLYDPRHEHDNCGVGFVADIAGKRSHSIIDKGLTILKNLIHRGAVGGDGVTGDGAGMLTQLPHELFMQEAHRLGFAIPVADNYAAGMLFLPRDESIRSRVEDLIVKACADENVTILGWREVPVDESVLGEIARGSLPSIKQIFMVADGLSGEELERKCYVLRRVMEHRAEGEGFTLEEFFIPSLSTKTIVYKGMLVGKQTGEFYLDLVNPDFRSAIAVIHQRYSTNTFPSWALAQPFRMVAHNGEINTIQGNIKKMGVREQSMSSPLFGEEIDKLRPVVLPGNSDSGSFDNVFELLVKSGRSMQNTMMMMVPEPFGDKYHISRDKRDYYLYHTAVMEAWDGPAALVFTDGVHVGATLDRNGLRPARWTITNDGLFVLGSEAGVLEFAADEVLQKGKLQPGKMILIDTAAGRIVYDREIKSRESRRKPFRRWLEQEQVVLSGMFHEGTLPRYQPEELNKAHHYFGFTKDDLDTIKCMAEQAQEPIGSMGNDTPLPSLLPEPQSLRRYFRQSFAQVTNPAIDPYRESMVMSLMSFIGREGNLLEESPERCRQLKLPHPVLTNDDMFRLCGSNLKKLPAYRVPLCFDRDESLESALETLQIEAETAIDAGASIVVLTDRDGVKGKLAIPALLGIAAVNSRLIRAGKRHCAGLVVETGEPVDTVGLALLVAFGASAINPYAVFVTIASQAETYTVSSPEIAADNYVQSLKKGLMKIMSKMGVSTIRSYRGGALFESIGLAPSLTEQFFPTLVNLPGTYSLKEIEQEIRARAARCCSDLKLLSGGLYRPVKDGIPHMLDVGTTKEFLKAITENSIELYQEFGKKLHSKEKPFFIRDLLTFAPIAPIPLDQVESVESILARFSGGAMSLGSLSEEAHEAIAVACNELGVPSNCGEGGESVLRTGTEKRSRVRQVASGRFGVTLDYLIDADEIQIKISQGAKPGEGGQLPGPKVTPYIAEVRGSIPGVTLISPPPHHDIYSIEDLAQLIYDLRSVNQQAKISVKLTSQAGVGTVAAGVVKAGADSIIISGHDGGTGASPLSSIFTTGTPWEIGLSEVRQTLILNKFRDVVELQVDGKLFTGEDIVKAAIMGADRFGFATGLLMAVGCVMCRSCHKNNCSVGIATQDEDRRKRFKGTVENVKNYLTLMAEDTRRVLASIGAKSIAEVIGDIHRIVPAEGSQPIDTTAILTKLGTAGRTGFSNRKVHGDEELLRRLAPAIANGVPMEIEARLTNRQRSVGATLSAAVYRAQKMNLAAGTVKCRFTGYAGQSFGAFLAPGVDFYLAGEANDYVGKSMCGGRITITPPTGSFFRSHDSVIAGNVALFGATGGELYCNGIVGERFAVRNSGAKAVVCSVGDHCCEYMTGGVVVVLDRTGINFGAGMSGGVAFVLDRDQLFDTRCNLELVDLEPVDSEEDEKLLKELIANHMKLTGSQYSAKIIEDWNEMLPQFVKVTPIEYRKALARLADGESRDTDTASVTDDIVEGE